MSEERKWSETSLSVYPSYEEKLVIMQIPVTVHGVETVVELCYPPEQARELAFTLTTTSMKIDEDGLE